MCKQIKGTLLVKSGTDFNELGEINVIPSTKILNPPCLHRNFHDEEDHENPRVKPVDGEVYEYNPPYIKDDKTTGDIPYHYRTINLNNSLSGSYEITVTKRTITKDITPDPYVLECVQFYED